MNISKPLANGPVPRFAEARVREALLDTRIVCITGPRQSGKTTLAKQISGTDRPFVSLDDATARAFAQSDPVGFVRQFDTVVIDEFQRAPELILALKMAVDSDGRPGRFLLTGSADIFATSRSPDSLAGRIERIELLPLSRAEILGLGPPTFVDRIFAGDIRPGQKLERLEDLIEIVLAGGFPEALARTAPKRRQGWYSAYVDALAQRDIPDLAALDKIGIMPRLIEQAALYSGQTLNLAAIGSELALDAKTVDRWLALLENIYLMRRVRPWFRNSFKRLAKTPKIQFVDSGLLASLCRIDDATIAKDRSLFGPLLECYVFGELAKSIGFNSFAQSINHYRDKDLAEVDFVIERGRGHIVGIEVKASATVQPRDFQGLKRIQDAAGDAFAAGVVLYDGETILPFGPKLFAMPVATLWS